MVPVLFSLDYLSPGTCGLLDPRHVLCQVSTATRPLQVQTGAGYLTHCPALRFSVFTSSFLFIIPLRFSPFLLFFVASSPSLPIEASIGLFLCIFDFRSFLKSLIFGLFSTSRSRLHSFQYPRIPSGVRSLSLLSTDRSTDRELEHTEQNETKRTKQKPRPPP